MPECEMDLDTDTGPLGSFQLKFGNAKPPRKLDKIHRTLYIYIYKTSGLKRDRNDEEGHNGHEANSVPVGLTAAPD